jgi:hypothetical protein
MLVFIELPVLERALEEGSEGTRPMRGGVTHWHSTIRP